MHMGMKMEAGIADDFVGGTRWLGVDWGCGVREGIWYRFLLWLSIITRLTIPSDIPVDSMLISPQRNCSLVVSGILTACCLACAHSATSPNLLARIDCMPLSGSGTLLGPLLHRGADSGWSESMDWPQQQLFWSCLHSTAGYIYIYSNNMSCAACSYI